MKRKLFVCALVAICLSLVAYGTLAYFTASETAHNVITSGDVQIELNEWADEDKTVPFPTTPVTGVMPGQAVTKVVDVKNTGSNAAYVRIQVDKAITLQGEGDPDLGLVVLDFNEEKWEQGDDGFYYYLEALEPGETTEPLFASVTFDKTMGNLYQNCEVTVDVTAHAVQVANNGETALEAKGWPGTGEEEAQ